MARACGTTRGRPGSASAPVPATLEAAAWGCMNSVILRHCPKPAALMPRGASAFAPWRAVRPVSNGGLDDNG